MFFEYHCWIDGENDNLKFTILTQKIDSINCANFEYALIKLAEFHNIVLDMKNVEYVSSMGIGVLVNIYKTIVKCGKSFKIINVSDTVKKVISVTKIPFSS